MGRLRTFGERRMAIMSCAHDRRRKWYMLLIIGGAYQGKLDFALELTKYKEKDFADGASCPLEEI